MICTKLNSIEWEAEIISAAYCRPKEGSQAEEILHLELKGDGGKEITLWLDEDAIYRHLERATGEFEEAEEIIGKRIVVVLDRHGDVTTFHRPFDEGPAVA